MIEKISLFLHIYNLCYTLNLISTNLSILPDIPAEFCPFGKVLEGRLCVPLNPGTTSGSTTSSTTTTTTTTTPALPPGPEPVQGACAEEWVESPDVPATCYRFVAGPNKWEEAKDLCELAKGHLVSISSAAEKVGSFCVSTIIL